MSTRDINRNVFAVREAARSMGARVLAVENRRKHHGVRIRTREGVEFWMRVSLGRIDPFKQKGWVRQAINRANARRANDNIPTCSLVSNRGK